MHTLLTEQWHSSYTPSSQSNGTHHTHPPHRAMALIIHTLITEQWHSSYTPSSQSNGTHHTHPHHIAMALIIHTLLTEQWHSSPPRGSWRTSQSRGKADSGTGEENFTCSLYSVQAPGLFFCVLHTSDSDLYFART
jgi:hypothetical protein